MSFPAPPMNLSEWNIKILNELIRYPGIESETFDFKERRMGSLANDICAMANTLGGVLVLGIGENEKNGRLNEFAKDGWQRGKEDEVNHAIGNHVYNVEPVPNLPPPFPIYDIDGTFYMVIKVEPVIKNRPHIVKGSGACYIRVGNQSAPASRDTILTLCKTTNDRITNIQVLKTNAMIVADQLEHINKQAEIISHRQDASSYYLPELNLESFKQMAAFSMWFMTEYDLIEANLVPGPERRHGFYTAINYLQELNGAIKRFNMDHGSQRGEHFIRYYQPWQGQHHQWLIAYFERILEEAANFAESSD